MKLLIHIHKNWWIVGKLLVKIEAIKDAKLKNMTQWTCYKIPCWILTILTHYHKKTY